jgi:deazaflavin-dependent oxidoreductase (nitroreductase family)
MLGMSSNTPAKAAWLPPRWFIRSFWAVHRTVYSLTRGRLGLKDPTEKAWGMLRITTIGRRSGQKRKAILGYFEDGPNLVTMAMNGWGEPEPAWWLNLQASPDTTVELTNGRRAVHGRAATPDERPRLWAKWGSYDGEDNLASWSARRPKETAVVILEPLSGSPDA